MKFLNQVTTHSGATAAPRIVVHGAGGVGKTTLGLSMPKPLLIPVEEGGGILSYEATPAPKTLTDLMDILGEIEALDKIEWETLVIDSIDRVEPMVWQHVCESKGKANIEDFGYGKGYTHADDGWIPIFQSLDRIRKRGIASFIIAHSASFVVDDPTVGSYNRMQPKLHKRASAMLIEWADVVGFLDIERVPVDRGSEKRTTRTSATTGKRRLHLEDGGGFAAKNRYQLASVIPIAATNGASPFIKALKPKKQGGKK